MLQTESCSMADQSKLISQHVQSIHYLSQSWLVGRFLTFPVAKPTRLVILTILFVFTDWNTHLLLRHMKGHVFQVAFLPKQNTFWFKTKYIFMFKCISCEVLTCDICLVSWNKSHLFLTEYNFTSCYSLLPSNRGHEGNTTTRPMSG